MSKLELQAFIGLHRLVKSLGEAVGQVHQEYGLTTGQFAVLEVLYHKGDLCVGQVQDKILSSTGTMPVIVSNLEGQGLISIRPDDRDRRKKILSLTDKGRKLIKEAYPPNEVVIIQAFASLEEEELEELVRITKKLDRTYKEV